MNGIFEITDQFELLIDSNVLVKTLDDALEVAKSILTDTTILKKDDNEIILYGDSGMGEEFYLVTLNKYDSLITATISEPYYDLDDLKESLE